MKKGKDSKKMQKKKNVKRKKKTSIIKKILRVIVYIFLLLFLLSVITIMGFGVYYFGTSPKYSIQNIKIEGNTIYSSDEIMEVAQIPMGENLFRMSSKQVENRINQLSYIADVNVKKKLSSTVKVILTERTSKYVAYNKETNKYLRLDIDGVVLEEIDLESKVSEELLVFGINFDDNFKIGDAIAVIELNKLKTYQIIYETYQRANLNKEVTSIEFKNSTLILTLNYDINVIINDDNNLEYNIDFLKNILKEIEGKSGTIDMTKENPVFTEKVK